MKRLGHTTDGLHLVAMGDAEFAAILGLEGALEILQMTVREAIQIPDDLAEIAKVESPLVAMSIVVRDKTEADSEGPVLPLVPAGEPEGAPPPIEGCHGCGKEFERRGPRHKYCPLCAAARKKANDRKRADAKKQGGGKPRKAKRTKPARANGGKRRNPVREGIHAVMLKTDDAMTADMVVKAMAAAGTPHPAKNPKHAVEQTLRNHKDLFKLVAPGQFKAIGPKPSLPSPTPPAGKSRLDLIKEADQRAQARLEGGAA